MSDIKSMLKDIETIVEHGASEIRKAAKKDEHTPQEIEAIKNIAKLAYYQQILKQMEDEDEDEGYSKRGRYSMYSGRGGNSMYDGRSGNSMYDGRGGSSMYDGTSYARGRRRDSMGRYSRRGGYSMDESRDMMMQKLEEAMREATSEHERQAIEQCMDKLM